MQTDLVEVTTTDGLSLSGALFTPSKMASGPIDAFVFFHGDGGHFYRPLYLGMGEYFSQRGIAFITANRRGHDMVAGGAPGGRLQGYAFESVAESPLDFGAWVDFLRNKGYTKIAIGGHSGGAVRAVYTQATTPSPNVVAVISVSPGEYDHEGIIALHNEAFTGPYQQATKNVASGSPDAFLSPGVPWGSMWTAQAYSECFHPDNRYSVSRHAENTRCPTLFVFGSEECAGPQILPVCGAARKAVTAAEFPHVHVETVNGANHGYKEREARLYTVIFDWIETIT
ncbi:MAG: alpha/beta fold hydrolase [SAR202 cluster bacterium]|nr:alpha/beta fold hydrolase [SAR202 cluster bacterium]